MLVGFGIQVWGFGGVKNTRFDLYKNQKIVFAFTLTTPHVGNIKKTRNVYLFKGMSCVTHFVKQIMINCGLRLKMSLIMALVHMMKIPFPLPITDGTQNSSLPKLTQIRLNLQKVS